MDTTLSVIEGRSLAQFVNDNSSRFEAGVVVLGNGCWVLLRDKARSGSYGRPLALEPIVDFEQYVFRAEENVELLHAGLPDLLNRWRTRLPV